MTHDVRPSVCLLVCPLVQVTVSLQNFRTHRCPIELVFVLTSEMLYEKALLVSQFSVNLELGLPREVEAEVVFVLLLDGGSKFVVRWRWKT